VRRFAREIDGHLSAALAATRDAMRMALASRQRHAESVDRRRAEEAATTGRLMRIEQALPKLPCKVDRLSAHASAMTM
jgi:hypothetical protein